MNFFFSVSAQSKRIELSVQLVTASALWRKALRANHIMMSINCQTRARASVARHGLTSADWRSLVHATAPVTDKLFLLYHWTNSHIKIVVSSKSLLANNQNNKSNIKTITTPLYYASRLDDCSIVHSTALHYTTDYTPLHNIILHFTSLTMQFNQAIQCNVIQKTNNTIQFTTEHCTTRHYTNTRIL